MKKLFILTTQTSDWFVTLGFKEGKKEDLPAEKKKAYNKKRNARVLVYAISQSRRGRILTSE